MKQIQLYKGTQREYDFIENGDSVVDFLSNPLRPCLVYQNTDDKPFDPPLDKYTIGWNYGNFREMHRFKTFVGDLSGFDGDTEIFELDSIADEKVLVKSNVRTLNFYTHIMKVAGQNGFCELIYDGTADDIIQEFQDRGYDIFELFPEKAENKGEVMSSWRVLSSVLNTQRKQNLVKRAKEIDRHFRRK
jgi:hypothetical protein